MVKLTWLGRRATGGQHQLQALAAWLHVDGLQLVGGRLRCQCGLAGQRDQRQQQHAAQRGWESDATVHSHCLLPSFVQGEPGGALHIAAETVRDDLGNADLRGLDAW